MVGRLRGEAGTEGPKRWCAPRRKSLLGLMDGTGLLLHERSLRLARPHLRPLAEGSFHWGLWKKLLSSAGCQVPERPARITPAQELKHAETQRQRHKEQFTPNVTRRRKVGEPRRRYQITNGISIETKMSK